eukprot:TRINITY_DN14466_c0_g1_i3.p1 TRINITY_DN14466_c0_g1~~TRINITY_DN14466_c0_g1_i3.p1  ORF type:complete len:105 (+),score=15.57 TRINITY_DN14466_c0_g1_i3:43-357(+)
MLGKKLLVLFALVLALATISEAVLRIKMRTQEGEQKPIINKPTFWPQTQPPAAPPTSYFCAGKTCAANQMCCKWKEGLGMKYECKSKTGKKTNCAAYNALEPNA